MPTVRKSAIVPHSCAAMFALVEAVERYPEFLPWCRSAEVLERTAGHMRARIEVDYHGFTTRFTTRNASRPPHEMALELVEGPFERFAGRWEFAPLGADGCRVGFALEYAFASAALEGLLGPVFSHIAETMVERFVQRAGSR